MADKKHDMSTDTVKRLADILRETDLTEIEVEQGEMRIRVSREPAPQMISHHAPAPAASAPAPTTASTAESAAASTPAAKAQGQVDAPMVGTVYMAAAPGADDFIKIGSKVKKGDTLLIIEAMKVMNPIPSPFDGTVKAILIDDADPVEYGQPIVIIE